MKGKKTQSLLANCGIFIFVFACILVVGEGVVRFLYKDETVLFPRYHTDAQYGEFTLRKIRPDTTFWHTSRDGSWKFTINKKGFRSNREHVYKKPDGTVRILSLGDSHTQGYEVRQDYTFSAVVERYLLNRGIEAEVINTGISGFSTAEELIFLEQEGIKYKPDFVILAFYANDYQDNLKANFFKLDDNGQLEIQKKAHIPGVRIQNIIYALPLVKWLSENSYFYSLLFNNTWNFFKARLAKKASDKVTEYAIPTRDTFSDYQTSLTAALIERMYNFCRENDIKLIVLDVPKIYEKTGIKPSISESLWQSVAGYNDAYIDSTEVLADLNGVAELHVPHGHRHISELTHTLLGIAAAKEIIALSK